jgi:hypothetical protein
VSPFTNPSTLVFASLVFAVPTASAQVTLDWSKSDRGVSIAVDAANNVFTADYEQQLGAEMTLTKRDVLGNLLWKSSFDQTDNTKWEAATWVATDAAGNAYLSGTSKSGYSNPVNAASLLVKFAPDGTVLWRKVYETSFDGSYTRKCLVDSAGDIYVLGMGSGPAGFVTKIKKFAPDGSTIWTWFDAAGIGAPVNFKFAPDGDLLISGRSIFGSIDGFARVDAAGNTVWSKVGIQSLTVGDVASDASGASYLVHGNYNGSGCVVKKVNAAGSLLFDLVYPIGAQRIEVGPDGSPVLAGFPANGGAGAAFLKIDAAGTQLWSNPDADGPLSLLLHAKLIVDDSNDAYFAAGTLFEMAVCKVNADGTSAWTKTMSGSYANDFVLGSHDSSIFVVGGATVRLLDAAEGPWTNVGKGLAGSDGIPLLFGAGSLASGTAFALTVADAAPNTLAVVILGASRVDLPLLGGTLVPAPDVLLGGIATGSNGGLTIAGTMPAGVPANVSLWMQTWLPDAGGVFGAAATNALRIVTP